MKNTKILFAVLLCVFLLSGPAAAQKIPFYLDLPAGYGTDDGVTGVMSEISFVQDSEIIQNAIGGIPAGSFTEAGVGFSDGYTFVAIGNDDEGLDDTGNPGGYEMTFVFNLSGAVTSFDNATETANFTFAPGGTVEVFVDNAT